MNTEEVNDNTPGPIDPSGSEAPSATLAFPDISQLPEGMREMLMQAVTQQTAPQAHEPVLIGVIHPDDTSTVGRGLILLEGALLTLAAMDPDNCEFITMADDTETTEPRDKWRKGIADLCESLGIPAGNGRAIDVYIKVGIQNSESYNGFVGPKWELPL